MEVRSIEKREVWSSFVESFESKTFLQSWNWGEFEKRMGKKIWRLGVFRRRDLLGAAFVFKEEARRGTHLIVPHGPLVKKDKKEVLSLLTRHLKKLGREEGASFVRIASIWERTEENEKLFERLGFRDAPIHIHPEVSWQLDLDRSEEEILSSMRKNTRYYVRKAMKNENIEVRKSVDSEDLDLFNDLYQKTADRHDFTPFSEEYIKNEFEVFKKDDQVMIFTGELEGEPYVSSIVIFWQGIAFYHQGASQRCKEPVSYGVQWEIMREAKRRGCSLYNFWGIADIDLSSEKSKNHPWWGLTLFKKGFGGRAVKHVKTKDLVLCPLYFLNYLVEFVRSKRRGFR